MTRQKHFKEHYLCYWSITAGRKQKFTLTIGRSDDAKRWGKIWNKNRVIQIILVFAAPHVEVYRCAPFYEVVIISRVLWDGTALFGIGTTTNKKTFTQLSTPQQKVVIQTNSVSFFKVLLLYWTSTTSCVGYENQMLKCDTSYCWGGNQLGQDSIRKCIPSRNTAVFWDMKLHMTQLKHY